MGDCLNLASCFVLPPKGFFGKFTIFLFQVKSESGKVFLLPVTLEHHRKDNEIRQAGNRGNGPAVPDIFIKPP